MAGLENHAMSAIRLNSKGRLKVGAYRRASGVLTPAETAQAELEDQGLSRKEIAKKLGVSIGTVTTRSYIIREKIQGAK